MKFPDNSLILKKFEIPWHFPDVYEPCFLWKSALNPEIWAENSENFNIIGDVTWTISSGKAEFANVEFVNIVRIFDNFAVPCRLNNMC